MAPFKIHATPETQHLLDAQIERQQQQQQQQQAQQSQETKDDQASQASTADPDDNDNADNADDADDDCIAIDTIETYTANVQNKKRVFADEILRV